MGREKNNHERPEAYPKPSETDNQLKNQDEYSTLKPNEQQAKSDNDLNRDNTNSEGDNSSERSR